MEMKKEVCDIDHPFDDFKIIDKLGKGGFGTVYKAEYCGKSRCFAKFVAIKEIDKTDPKWKGHRKFVDSEIKIHKRSHHQNIVQLYHVLDNGKKIWLILELCSEGTLEKMLEQHKAFDETIAYKIFKQIVAGVMFLHSRDVIHRDLTLANILLTEEMRVKIADFGLSTKLNEPNDLKYTVVGTPRYFAPEIKNKEGHNDKVDIWNLGCILYALLVGKLPKKGDNIHYPKNISKEAKKLLESMLDENASRRFCIEGVSESSFFQKHEKKFKSKMESYRSEDSGNGSNHYTIEKKGRSRSRDSGFDSARIRNIKKLTHSYERCASEDRNPYTPLSCNNVQQQYRNNTKVTLGNNSRGFCKSREKHENDDSCISSWKSPYSFSPESIEHFIDPSCRMKNSLLKRQLGVCSSTCSHVGYCDNKCSHNGTCSCQYHSFPNGEKNINIIPPLNAIRLKPKRHCIKERNIVMHISTDRQVFMEVLKIKRDKEYVSEVLSISTDGMEIRMYNPPKNTLLDKDSPPPFPNDSNEIKNYSYSNFPYRKKYLIAKKFVDTLRAKTPKLIINGQNAKFYVMENNPDPDCRMNFYDGSSVIKKGKDIFITDKHGKKHFSSTSQSDIKAMMLEFECEKSNCERILKFHESLESPNFPIIIGMPKNDLCSSGGKAGKENFISSTSMTSRHKKSKNR